MTSKKQILLETTLRHMEDIEVIGDSKHDFNDPMAGELELDEL